ncbi:hypothetical protein Vadar_005301 [Vaccinium darrowii]|uniref:Uncharacterized protein n=1 Tax=Vaccinium darrowii TaxID=229202 RepID=A0ACB7Z1W1_9ERIC|nr:hypothetical protein Vadar_005301 [Vaccinium darrowii]
MALNSKSLLALLLTFNIILAITDHAIAGRKHPTSSKDTDKKQPQFLIDRDGSFLVPGIGRFMFPKKGPGFNPFTYNPVTGTSGGSTGSFGGGSSGTGGGGSYGYVPGGDDTPVPNPGVEVPNPAGSGGGIPSAAARP